MVHSTTPARGWARTLLVVGLLACSAASGAAASSDSDERVYRAEIATFDSQVEFANFLFDHDGGSVQLDVRFDIDSNPDLVGDTWVLLWMECEEMPDDLLPSADYCTGVEVELEGTGSEPVLRPEGSNYVLLRGSFRVTAHEGMHQGLLSMTLAAEPDSAKAPRTSKR